MNNTRADMFHDLVCEHRKLSDAHSKLLLELRQKGKLDDRDAAHKVEVEQLMGRIAELLEEKEQREGQLKKTQDLLVASETDASTAHAELTSLKEQATKWEVTVAQLNADLASKLQILFLQPARHIMTFSGTTFTPAHTLLLTYFLFLRHVARFRRRR
jgi:chromosome segregation ATPase